MTRDHAMKIKPGDMLRPDPRWNATEREARQMPDPVRVHYVWHGTKSQTGVIIAALSKGGTMLKLDAAWFLGSE